MNSFIYNPSTPSKLIYISIDMAGHDVKDGAALWNSTQETRNSSQISKQINIEKC
jgi:hypothetical protein